MTLESWRWMDPERVYERIEESRLRRHTPARTRAELLFGDDDMGRKLDIPPRVSQVCFAWGQWANRQNFWTDLRITPFCKLLGIAGGGHYPLVRLDPESHRVHKAFHTIGDDKTKAVLYAYYVRILQWDDRRQLFKRAGIQRASFYRLLKDGSLMLYNASGIASDDRKAT